VYAASVRIVEEHCKNPVRKRGLQEIVRWRGGAQATECYAVKIGN
jgi:hypothetical protein